MDMAYGATVCEEDSRWFEDSVLYHIYPLGLLGCERRNAGGKVCHRLPSLAFLIDHLKKLGVTAVYFGPLFESSTHGYDTKDYFHIDRRLGSDEDFIALVGKLHDAGIRVIVDAVFNHVGREFWGFEAVLRDRDMARTRSWFRGLRFDGRCRDGVRYDTWEGHEELVKLDLANPQVREHLFQAVSWWIHAFHVDGIRLDAADCLDHDFVVALRAHAVRECPDFLIVGEVIHGDYRRWANETMMHGTTNYEAYKGLWSSHNDGNYHEIAYSLNRQFGPLGIYRGLQMYSFADNHDVERVASQLKSPASLYALYAMMFLMPGTPSIYYGSEWGILGRKGRGYDADVAIRPAIDVRDLAQGHVDNTIEGAALEKAIARLAHFRTAHDVLCRGDYRQIAVSSQWIAFERSRDGASLCCIVSDLPMATPIAFALPDGEYEDVLNGGDRISVTQGQCHLEAYPHWARVLRRIA